MRWTVSCCSVRRSLAWLAQGFVDERNEEKEANRNTIPPAGFDCLFRHDWPGNVRELRQVVRNAAMLADSESGPIKMRVLQEATRRQAVRTAPAGIEFDPLRDSWKDVDNRAWERYAAAVLKSTGYNKSAAAKRAGMSRSAFLDKLSRLPPPDQHNQ